MEQPSLKIKINVPKRKTEESDVETKKKKQKKKSDETVESGNEEIPLLRKDFTKNLILKTERDSRPLWVCPDKHIFLEAFSPLYQQASDFLVTIAEPDSRANLIHEYQLTRSSLGAAISVGLSADQILKSLDVLSKVKVPQEVVDFVRKHAESYGKVKLVLQKNSYFLESTHPQALQALLKDPVIAAARLKTAADATIDPNTGLIVTKTVGGSDLQISGGIKPNQVNQNTLKPILENESLKSNLGDDDEDDDEEAVDTADSEVHSFEIDPNQIEKVKERCYKLEYPTMEEYDFRNDTVNPSLAIDLKITANIRPYQEKSLSKMFGNGRARSGIIVLPCGAGKTLVGITAACTVKKSVLVLCNSGVSVEQWRYQFKLWSTVEDKYLIRFTSRTKERLPTDAAVVVVSTYTMVANTGRRSKESGEMIDQLKRREWGLVLLDEVHVVPAHIFRKVLTVCKAHCKLGLTATLVREDDKIKDLNFLIGPKLYEANWLDLTRSGYLANVQCVEVWCPMGSDFYRKYLDSSSAARKRLLYIMNPIKFRYCEFLIRYHEARGDKIMVFSDTIFTLKEYATMLRLPYVYGDTPELERLRLFQQFQHNPKCKTIFISKVGDTSIDLPETNVIIQISSQFGSRRQEAQRLGRILRPKARSDDEYNAFFYSLVSKDTEEMYFSAKRRQFLIDQGYSYKVLSSLPLEQEQGLHFDTRESQQEWLMKVLNVAENEGQEENIEDEDEEDLFAASNGTPSVSRTVSSGKSLTGASAATYIETKAAPKVKKTHHPVIQKYQKSLLQQQKQ